MVKFRPGFLVLLGLTCLATATPAKAGSLIVSWDATQGASGYHVYYGTTSGTYTESITTAGTTL